MVVIVLLFVLARSILTLLYPLGVSVGQAELGLGEITKISSVPWVIHNAWYLVFGVGELQLRLLGVIIYILLVFCLFSVYRRSTLLLVIIAFNPWINSLTIWYLPEAITLLMLCLSLQKRFHILLRLLFWLFMILSSFSGAVGGILVAFNFLRKNPKIFLVSITVWLSVLISFRTDFVNVLKKTTLPHIKTEFIERKILNEDLKYVYLGANRELMPNVVRKIGYNYYVYVIDSVVAKAVILLDPTAWTASGSAFDILTLSGFPTKGVLDLFHYWEIPFLAIGLFSGSGVLTYLLLAGVGTSALFEGFTFIQYGFFVLPTLTIAIYRGTLLFSRKNHLFKYLIIGLYLVAGFFWLKTTFFQRESHQLLAEYSYRTIYDLYLKTQPNSLPVTITTKIDMTEKMFAFYTDNDVSMVTFSDIESLKTPDEDRIYIGFKNEFTHLPAGVLLHTQELPGQIIQGIGQTLWVVKY